MTAGSWSEPWATARNAPMPCSAIHSRPWTSTSTPSISRARSASALGVRSLAGVSCSSRAKFCASAPTAPRCDGVGDVVVAGDDDLLELARRLVLGARAVAVEAVGGQDRALDQRGGHVVGDVVGQLPAQRCGCRARARGRGPRPRRRARARRRSASRRAEADEQPAPAVGVVQGEVLEARARLAGLEQRAQRRALEIVGDALVVEDADGDRVGLGGGGSVGGGGGVHRPARLRH